jgi:predicted nucleotidyltransferase
LGRVREAFPEENASGILFGSRARGEGGTDSDMDLLVVLTTDDLAVRRRVFDLAYEVFLETDVLISPLVLSRDNFAVLRRAGRRLARDIERDGVAV